MQIEQVRHARGDRRAAATAHGQGFRQLGRLAVVLAAAVLIVLTWLGTRNAIRAHRAEAEARVEAESLSKALLIEEQLRRELLGVEQTLRFLEYQWQQDPAKFDFAAWMRQAIILHDMSLQVFIADEHGIVRASSRPGIIGTDVSARDYFRHEAGLAADEDRMFVGALTRGQITRLWQMNLVRRLDRPDGSFGGVIAVSYDTNSFARFWQQVDLGPRGLIGIVSMQAGNMWFQAGASQAGKVTSIGTSALFQAMTAAPQGYWTGPSAVDEVDRIYAFATVPDRDLKVMVGIGLADAMRPANEWEDGALIFASGITLLVLLMAGLLLHEDWAARRRHEALARERAVLEAALSGMSDGIMMVDKDLNLLEWNRRFPEFTGVPEDILQVGLPMEEMLRAQAEAGEYGQVDVDTEVARRMMDIRSGASFGTRERQRPGGRQLEVRRNPLPGGGFVTLYSDVTARHEADERLRQAQTLAAVGRLTAGVAHDFNNLLASISGNTEMLVRHLGDHPAHGRRLSIILQAVGRGADLVRQLLAFSRKQALVPTRVDLNQVVIGIKDLLGATLGKTIQLTTAIDPQLWPALVDPVQVEHVILNLTINARDAMPDGGTLTIATGNVSLGEAARSAGMQPGDYVFVAVTDTGTGMTEEVLRNAFEPFFTTKPPGQGSGLGLSQVYGVANQSGGGVQIDSVLNEGTTVKVFFPRASTEVLPPPKGLGDTGDARDADIAEAALADSDLTVLLVDDEADCRETVGAMLASSGVSVITADGGEAALRLFEQGRRIDLLLVDYAMPGMNGVEVARAVRSLRPSLPVVFFTGGDSDWVGGERWVLTKPFLSRSLTEMVWAAYGAAQDSGVARRTPTRAL